MAADPAALDPRFKDCEFVVEANSFEVSTLWRDFHDRPRHPRDRIRRWEQDQSGLLIMAGQLDGRPVNVCFTFARLDGHPVAFFDPCSQLVDHQMVDEWLKRNCNPTWDGGARRAHTDAMNFHHVLSHVKSGREASAKL